MTNFSAKSLVSPGTVRLFLASVVVVHHSLPLRAGSWAVDVFFILSGYWITRMWNTHYCRTKASYFTFLVSRWWRLLPVFLVCIGFGVASAFLLHGTGNPASPSTPSWWLRQMIIIGSSDAGRVLPPTWSLDVEMQFYLIAPILIWTFAKVSAGWRWMAVAALLAALAGQLATGTYPESARFGLFSGFFLAGLTLALRPWTPGAKITFGGLALFLGGTLALLALPHVRNGIWIEGKLAQLGTDRLAGVIASTWWVIGGILAIPFIARSLAIRSSALDRLLGDLAYPLYLLREIKMDQIETEKVRIGIGDAS